MEDEDAKSNVVDWPISILQQGLAFDQLTIETSIEPVSWILQMEMLSAVLLMIRGGGGRFYTEFKPKANLGFLHFSTHLSLKFTQLKQSQMPCVSKFQNLNIALKPILSNHLFMDN